MINLVDKRVLVTGGSGFLGSHVCEVLSQRGVTDVTAPSRSDVDLTNQQSTFEFFRDLKPEIVIHLAAEVGGIAANKSNPGRFFYANMTMGLNVVEASRIATANKLVMVGTVCGYPKDTPIPFKEEDLWNGYPEPTNAPYGVAKRVLLTMVDAYGIQYDLNAIYLLPANLYGPRDNFDLETSHVIPALIRKVVAAKRSGREVTVWGSGAPSREFLYVSDAAEAIIMAAERYESQLPVNVGTGQEITIRALVELIATLIEFDGPVVWDSSRPDGQQRRSLDVSRARDEFGFTAKVGLEEGLTETIRWWRENSAP